MTIRNGEEGDLVWMNYGAGPKARILERHNFTNSRTAKEARGIYYTVKIEEDLAGWYEGDQTVVRGKSLTRHKCLWLGKVK
jgi:hypothetical protein